MLTLMRWIQPKQKETNIVSVDVFLVDKEQQEGSQFKSHLGPFCA